MSRIFVRGMGIAGSDTAGAFANASGLAVYARDEFMDQMRHWMRRLVCAVAILSALRADPTALLADVTFSLVGGTAPSETEVVVPVTVSGFSSVSGFQFTVEWNVEHLRFSEVGGFQLPGFSGGSFNLTLAAAKGRFSVSWDDPEAVGKTLVDGSVLFTARFMVVGSPGASALARITDSVTPREVVVGIEAATFLDRPGTILILDPPRKDPSIEWIGPTSIEYGTPLNEGQLNAKSSVPGTFSYSPTAGAILGAGERALNLMFTPADPARFNSVTATRTLSVSRKGLKVSAESKSRVVGQMNPPLTVNYEGFVNGENPSVLSPQPVLSTTALVESPPGSYPITFATAPQSANYQITTVDGVLTIRPQQEPIIDWLAPAPISYGTPVGPAELNAKASVAGKFEYKPSIGTLLPAGAHMLSATFTPDDGVEFKSITKTVLLSVDKKVLTVTARDHSRVYGAPNPVLEFTISGFAGNETAAVLAEQPVAFSAASSTSPVGSYPATPRGGAAANYVFAYVEGVLKVTPATLLAKAENQIRPARTPNPELTVSFVGFANGETESVLDVRPVLATTATGASPAGEYPITFATPPRSSNYLVTTVDGVLTVFAVNAAPVAGIDAITTPEDTPVKIDVLLNDTDLDGDTLLVTSASVPSNGVSLVADGGRSLSYSPNQNFHGLDTFVYTLSDGNGGMAEGRVNIEVTPVNDPPVAVRDVVETLEDTPVELAVLSNDADVEDKVFTLVAVTGAGHGTPTVSADSKTILYVPNKNFHGKDSFTYTVQDSQKAQAIGLVEITVKPVNDPPVIEPVAGLIERDGGPVVLLPEAQRKVVAIDVRDPESPSESISIQVLALVPALLTENSLKFKREGSLLILELEAVSGRTGSTTVEIVATDPGNAEARTRFTVSLAGANRPPTITGLKDVQVEAGRSTTPLEFIVADDITPASAVLVSVVSANTRLIPQGSVQLTRGGVGKWTLVATPVLGGFGMAIIDVFVQDEAGLVTLGKVGVRVLAPNQAPELLVHESITVDEDGAADVLVQIADDRTAKDKIEVTLDPANPGLLSVVLASRPSIESSSVFGSPFVIRVRPSKDYFGETKFSIRARDEEGGSALASVNVIVRSVNDAPVLSDIASLRGVEDLELGPIEISASDAETPFDKLAFFGRPVADGRFRFRFEVREGKAMMWIKPEPDWFGTASGFVEVVDSEGLSSARAVSVTFTPVNDAPVIEPIAEVRGGVGQAVDVRIRMADDEPLDPARLAVVSSNAELLDARGIEVLGTGASRILRLRPKAGVTGESTITLRLTDIAGATGVAEFKFIARSGSVAPELAALGELVVVEGQQSPPISFVVPSIGVDLSSVRVTVKASNQTLLKDSKIGISRSGSLWELVLSPEPSEGGSLTLDVLVESGLGFGARQAVPVLVTKRPTISNLSALKIVIPQDSVGERIPIGVSGDGRFDGDLEIVVKSSDEDLLPLGNFEIAGNGAQRFVRVTPGVNRTGTAAVTLLVRDPNGGEASTTFSVEVRQMAPLLLLERAGVVARAGSTIDLQGILVGGSRPVDFQWQFEGSNLPGETSSGLRLAVLTPAMGGSYRLIASNKQGRSEAVARVAVVAIPEIIEEPRDQSVAPGTDLTLRVNARGQSLRYQWRKNGEILVGETMPTLLVPKVRSEDGGVYTVEVSVEARDQAGRVIHTGVQSRSAIVTVLVGAMPMVDHLADMNDMPAGEVVNMADGRVILRGAGRSNNLNATIDGAEGESPIVAGSAASMWIRWRAPMDGVMRIDTRGSSFDTVMGLYEPGSDPLSYKQLVLRGSSDDLESELSGGASGVLFFAEKDRTYYITVDGLRNARGVIGLNWEFVEGIIPVPEFLRNGGLHDARARVGETAYFSVVAVNAATYRWRRLKTVGGQVAVTTLSATGPELRIPKVTLDDAALYELTIGNGRDEVVRTARLIVVGEGDGLLVNNKLGAAGTTTAAQSQRLAVRSNVGVGKFSAAASSGFRGTQVFDSIGSTLEQGEIAACDIIGGASQWLTYIAPTDGILRVSTEGSSFDTLLGVFHGPADQGFDSLTLLACDNNSGSDGQTSILTVQVRGGQAYYIAVDGVNRQSGFVQLGYELTKPDVSVALPPPALETGTVELRAPGILGARYVLQSSVNLVAWSTLMSTNASTPTILFKDPESADSPKRFYRLIKE